MDIEPDPDWYLDNVLYYAEPGTSTPIRVTEATLWDAWWRKRADEIRSRWPRLAPLALQNGFVLTTRQLRELDVARHAARSNVGRGVWSCSVRGTVALVGTAAWAADESDRWTVGRRIHALEAAAAIVINPGHVVTGNSAAVLHGLSALEVPARPELTMPTGGSARRAGARVATLPRAHRASWFGVPVATAPRAVVDVARADRRAGLVVADAALRNDRATSDQLTAIVDASAGWPGISQARNVVSLAERGGESPLESLLRLAIHDAGLPAPALQVTVQVPGRRVPYRVDMLWPRQRFILEADGRVKYGKDVHWAEKKRDLALHRRGFRVEHVLWSDVLHTWPATYAMLAEALCR